MDEEDIVRIPRVDQFIKNTGQLINFVYNYDPLSIYKGNYKLANRWKYKKLYLRPELKFELGPWNVWQRRLRLFFVCLYIWWLARIAMICLVQVVIYQATSYNIKSSVRMKETTAASLDQSMVTQSLSITRETESIKWLRRWYLYDVFANILSDFPCVSLPLYGALVIIVSYVILYMPSYYRHKPYDPVSLRMALEPGHETRRLDLQLEQEYARHKEAVLAYERQRSSAIDTFATHPRATSLVGPGYELAQLTDGKQWQQQPQVALRAEPELVESLRPSYCWLGYRRYWLVVRRCFCFVVLPSIAFSIEVLSYILDRTRAYRCKVKQSMSLPSDDERDARECETFRLFSVFELYSLFEIIAIFYWIGITLVTSLLNILAHMDAQLNARNELKQELGQLCALLEDVNGSRREQQEANCKGRPAIQDDLLNDLLLRQLVKTDVQLEEFKARAAFVSEQASAFVVFFVSGLMVVLLAAKLDGPDIEKFRMAILEGFWLAANAMLLMLAYLCAKMTKLQQQFGWRIAAQLCARVVLSAAKRPRYRRPQTRPRRLDPLTYSWLQLIWGECLADPRNSAKTFGVSLTYKRLLQMNFYVTSLAALVFR